MKDRAAMITMPDFIVTNLYSYGSFLFCRWTTQASCGRTSKAAETSGESFRDNGVIKASFESRLPTEIKCCLNSCFAAV